MQMQKLQGTSTGCGSMSKSTPYSSYRLKRFSKETKTNEKQKNKPYSQARPVYACQLTLHIGHEAGRSFSRGCAIQLSMQAL